MSAGIGPQHTTGRASATGIVTDIFGLNVPGVAAGTVYSVIAQVRIDGYTGAGTTPTSLAADDTGGVAAFSSWQSRVRLSQGVNGPTLVELRARENCDQRKSSFGIHGCETTGLTGPQLQIYFNASVSAGTSNYHLRAGTMKADSVSDMSNTLAWAGVTEIRDASGAAGPGAGAGAERGGRGKGGPASPQ